MLQDPSRYTMRTGWGEYSQSLEFSADYFHGSSRGSERALRETAVQPGSVSVGHALRKVLGKDLCRLSVIDGQTILHNVRIQSQLTGKRKLTESVTTRSLDFNGIQVNYGNTRRRKQKLGVSSMKCQEQM